MQNEAIQLLQKTDADKLPTLPHVLLHLLDACQDENVSFERLANVIRKDPALCVKIISACGVDCASIYDLEQALARLGINTIKSIAITSAVQQFFSRSNEERTRFLKQHWHHSMFCACLAEQLAEYINYKHLDEAWFAGLLHDTGQLVMEATYPDRYSAAFAQLSEDELFHEMENEEFDATHYHVGSGLFRKHDSNPFLADAIMYHHEPVEKILDAHPLVKLVNLANLIGHEQFMDNPADALNAAEQLFGLSAPLVEGLVKNCIEKVESVAEEFDVDFISDDMDEDTVQKVHANDQLKQVQLAEQIRNLSLIHISEPTRQDTRSRIPSYALK